MSDINTLNPFPMDQRGFMKKMGNNMSLNLSQNISEKQPTMFMNPKNISINKNDPIYRQKPQVVSRNGMVQ